MENRGLEMRNKIEEMKRIEEMVNQKMNEKERIWMLGKISSSIVCRLAKQLIKNIGYAQVVTIIQRELRECGVKDAKKIMELFKLEPGNPETASKVLKIAAIVLGMNLDVKRRETVITECPYGDSVKEFPYEQPFYCNICRDYCRGLIEGVIGDNFTFIQTSSMSEGNEFCAFETKKR
jgi:predicted hydrocarbon binding protein